MGWPMWMVTMMRPAGGKWFAPGLRVATATMAASNSAGPNELQHSRAQAVATPAGPVPGTPSAPHAPEAALARPARCARSVVNASSGRSSLLMLHS